MGTITGAQFEQLVKNLLSADNETRNQAADAYEELKKGPDVLAQMLLHIIRHSQILEVSGPDISCHVED